MSDVLTITDLETAKKHDTFHNEVITGKVGGLSTGADIDYATNQVTRQVQKTLPKTLRDLGMMVQTWTATTGGTLTDASQVFLDDITASAGKGNYYAWTGTFPKVVAPGTDPAAVTGYVPRTDVTLRDEINNTYPAEFDYFGLTSQTKNYINFIASNPKFAYGDVALGGGTDTQINLRSIGDFSMLSINGIKLKSDFVGGKPLRIPTEFPWNPGICAFSESYGKVSVPFFDITKYDFTASQSVSFVTLYVDPVLGNNYQPIPNASVPNEGTDPALPLRSVSTAFERITSNSYAYTLIALTGGYYYDTASWGSRSPTSNVVVKQWSRGDNRDKSRPVLSSETALSWTHYSGTVYSSTRSSVSWVVDETVYNEYGDWKVYTKAASLADCISTAGSWYQSETTIYVNRLNGAAVNSDIHVMTSKSNAGCSAGNYILYVEGVDFFGGAAGFAADSRTVGTSDTVVMNDCRFFYSNSNGFENYGVDTCITKDCVAAYTMNDGFNYHSNRDTLTQVCKSLEINNRSYMTGRSDSVFSSPDSSNGSTCHESNIVIRLGGSYEKSMGPVVADVGSCITYNFCVSARESIRAGSTPRKSSFLSSGSGTKQYIDNCQAIRSEWSLDVYSGGVQYVEDINIDSSIEGIENISKIAR